MAKQRQPPQRPLSADYLQEVRERIRTGADEVYYQLGVPNPHIPSIMQLGIEDAPKLLREVERLLAMNTALREIAKDVAEVRWSEYCPWCDSHGTIDEVEHYDGCPVLTARKLTGATPLKEEWE